MVDLARHATTRSKRYQSIGRRIARCALVALAVGCSSPRPPPPPVAPIPSASDDAFVAKLRAIQERMHRRFDAAYRIEQAIAFGDLERAHVEARTLRSLAEPDALPVWRPYFARIEAAASAVDESADLMVAARRSAELGAACGSCHVAIDAHVTFANDPLPPPSARLLAPQMTSHQWATQQMWSGLIGPSDERWRIGAETLAGAHVDIVAMAVTPYSTADVDDAARMRSLADSATKARTSDERADAYGRMLATCTHCHATLRDR